MELMAGAEHEASPEAESERFQGIPDLNTVLAEAGVEEVRPPSDEGIAASAAPDVPRDDRRIMDPNVTDQQQ